MGGGSTKASVDVDPKTITETLVSSDGTISFQGSGEFSGAALSADAPSLADSIVYIEKKDSAYSVSGYISLSSVFDVRFTENASSEAPETLYPAELTLPYDQSILSAEGGAESDVRICMLSDGSAVSLSSDASSGLITGDINIPYSFFSCFYKETPAAEASGTIVLSGISYKDAADAGEVLTDPAGTELPDTARGTNHVQLGEKVVFKINQPAFGEPLVSSQWSLSGRPAGSAAEVVSNGSTAYFIPDTTGIYSIKLTLTGVNGKTSAEMVSVIALDYSYSAAYSTATCLNLCHDGSNTGEGSKDKYGRDLFRDIVAIWQTSDHADAFSAVQGETDTSCLQCHTTGYFFADRDADGSDDYTGADGFDDTITNWSDPADTGVAYRRNVGCESCHGPGDNGAIEFSDAHYSDTPTDSAVCLSCHEHGNPTGHFFEYSDTHDTIHELAGGNVAVNTGCFNCHTGEGAMGMIFNVDITPSNTDSLSGAGCSVCHDPHGEGGNNAQLRISGSYTIELSSGDISVNAGDGLVCYKCHNSDTELPAVGTFLHNTQAEMLQGVGGYGYGQIDSPVLSDHGDASLTCSDCHMQRTEGVTHQMLMSENTSARLDSCTSTCHAVQEPVYSAGYYELGTKMAEIRAKVSELKTAINAKAGLPADSAVQASYSSEDAALREALNRAAYNYNFINSDKSSGFHNPDYTEALLDLSLADLAEY